MLRRDTTGTLSVPMSNPRYNRRRVAADDLALDRFGERQTEGALPRGRLPEDGYQPWPPGVADHAGCETTSTHSASAGARAR